MIKRPLSMLALACMFLAACAGVGQEETRQEVVTTDLAAYMQGQNIVVTYDNMQGAPTDWIAIARTTDEPTVYWEWQYTGGGTSGSLTFVAPNLAQGTYEARAYYDWNGTASYAIQQRSAPFTVSGNAMLAPSAPSYGLGQPIVINYSGFSGSTTDWISLHTPGAADTQYTFWQYTGGGTSGMVTFTGVPEGTYEARYHADWDGTHSHASSATSSQFTVGAAPSVITDRTTYGTGEVVTASYSNMPGNMLDYVAVSVAGSAPTSTVQRFYTNGQINGSQAFNGLPAGSYEARIYENDTANILDSFAFTVTAASISTDATTYAAGTPVTVTYSGLPGNMQDWIAISTAGSSDSEYIDFVYTGGQTMGTAVFNNLPPGSYEARAYLDNTFNVLARSAVFTVGATCNVTQSPVFESLSTGTITLGAADLRVTTPLTVALDRSILFTSMRERENSPQYGAVTCSLHAADPVTATPAGITCARNAAGTDTAGSSGVITIRYTVATFTSGVTVQRGVARTYPTTNPALVTLSPAIDPATSFVVLNGVFTGGTGWGNNEFTRARIVDASTLEIAHGTIGAEVTWQVVSMVGASVQRGTTTLASGATTQSETISAVPAGSLVLASYTTDNPSGIGANALMLHASLQGSDSIFFQRGAGGASMSIAYEVVSMPFLTLHGNSVFAAGVAARTETVTGISATTSVGISPVQALLGQSGGLTSFAGSDLVGEATATLSAGSGSLVVERASTTGAAQIPWTVIDFSRDCAGN